MRLSVQFIGPLRRRIGSALLRLTWAMVLALPLAAAAQTAGPAAPVRFGILPLGGAFESRNDWEPVLADLGRATTSATRSTWPSCPARWRSTP